MNTNPEEDGEINTVGGRKKTRKSNPVLASWRKFVTKIQHEEKLTYPEAMKRASKRKSEWKRGGDGDGDGDGGMLLLLLVLLCGPELKPLLMLGAASCCWGG